jgi:manganese efflux pump family protein
MAAAGAALAATLLVTACAAGPAQLGGTARFTDATRPGITEPLASTEPCYAFAVSALRRHIVVRRRPAACAGLAQAQVNQDVARAIRTVVGPHPKAAARRLALADSRYLAGLVRPVKAAAAVPPTAGPTATTASLPGRLAALAAWVVTAAAGAYLLAGWLTGERRRGRRIQIAGVPQPVVLGHAGLAVAGLGIWIAFTVTPRPALGWIDVGLTWVIAGLGMATLVSALPEHRAGPDVDHLAANRPAEAAVMAHRNRVPVLTIALHGVLATATILLVLLAVIGVG